MCHITTIRPFLAILLTTGAFIAIGSGVRGAEDAPDKKSPATATAPKHVTLTIDYGDGFQKRFTQIPWQKDMTVLTALEHARRHARGKIQFRQRGKSTTALLLEIDGVKNDGGRGKNWLFHVNDQFAEQSFAATPLEPGDAVLWKFDHYR